ncbi:MAG: hypothetical protein JNL93_12785 [Pelomonas sp.]|nr:hypothetical protein [Roseateles sp.]
MNRFLVCLLPLALAACAAAPQADKAQAGADAGTVCDRETRTGTLMPTTRCTTAAEREAAQRAAQSVGDAVRQQSSAPPSKGS